MAQPIPTCPTYIATVQRDEAGLILMVIDNTAAAPWIGWRMMVGSALVVYVGSWCSTMFVPQFLGAPPGTGSGIISRIALGVALVLTLGPFLVTFFVAILRRAPFAFGSEGLVAASTVRIQPSQTPPWNGNNNCWKQYPNCWKQYPQNPNISGYRHSFFYRDENVIDDVATSIRLNEQNASSAAGKPAAEPSAARGFSAGVVQAVGAWWFAPLTALVVLVAFFSWSFTSDIRELRKAKYDLAPDVSSITDGATPVPGNQQLLNQRLTFAVTPFTFLS